MGLCSWWPPPRGRWESRRRRSWAAPWSPWWSRRSGTRRNCLPGERRRCLLVCDEFQTVTGADWEGMLAEIRKYGCSLMLATQSLARLDTSERKLKAGYPGQRGGHHRVPDVRGGRPHNLARDGCREGGGARPGEPGPAQLRGQDQLRDAVLPRLFRSRPCLPRTMSRAPRSLSRRSLDASRAYTVDFQRPEPG